MYMQYETWRQDNIENIKRNEFLMAEGEKTKVWEEAELLCEKVRDAHWKI